MVHWDRKAYRRQLVMQIGVVLLLILIIALTYDHKRGGLTPDAMQLTLIQKEIVPLKEISGLAVFRDGDKDEVAFVSDNKAKLFLKNEDKEYDFKNLLVERFSLCQDEDYEDCGKSIKKLAKNWEALAIDGQRRFFVLQEHSQSILVLDRQVSRIEHVIHFNFGQAFSEAVSKGSKKLRKNALGEGLVLLKNGHILVAKEAFPVAIVEFGPEGEAAAGLNASTVLQRGESFKLDEDKFRERLVPLHTWLLAAHGKCDISDLAIDKDKSLLALSEDCLTVQRYPELVPGKDAEIGQLYLLPAEIKSPEGLAVVGDEWLVGSDVSSKKQYNYYRIGIHSGLK